MYKNYLKRVIDIILSLILIPIIIPIIAVFSLIIKSEDYGPIFYVSGRLGKDGKIFKMYKLRSMKVGAPDLRNKDGSTYNSANDDRLTKVGKFIRKTSIDELPQIFNILKGDMSFIGPRPDLPEHYFYYENDEYRKLDVLPGVSGYNQAYHRNTVAWKGRIQNDLYYVNNLNFMLDLKIFYRTIFVIILRRGVYSGGQSSKQVSVNEIYRTTESI